MLARLVGCRAAFARAGARALSSAVEGGVRITPSCAERLKSLAAIDGGRALRIAVDSGGCSGFQYTFKLEPLAAPRGPKDRVFEQDGASIVVDALSLEYLQGATVDYVQEMVKSSFEVVDNPNSEASCGCGTSFSPK